MTLKEQWPTRSSVMRPPWLSRAAAAVAGACIVATTTSALAGAADEQHIKAAIDTAALVAKVAILEAQVAYLGDRQRIHDVYLRYQRGFDRNDVDLLKSAFWPGAQINFGFQSNSFDQFVIRHLKQDATQLSSSRQLITNETVDINGDVAHVETYVTAFFKGNKKSPRTGKAIIGGGRFIDRLDRRHGEWRIAVREFIPQFWIETGVIAQKNWPRSACAMGTWDKRDPSYTRPLYPRAIGDVGPACAR